MDLLCSRGAFRERQFFLFLDYEGGTVANEQSAATHVGIFLFLVAERRRPRGIVQSVSESFFNNRLSDTLILEFARESIASNVSAGVSGA
jgi:hypothetical protein